MCCTANQRRRGGHGPRLAHQQRQPDIRGLYEGPQRQRERHPGQAPSPTFDAKFSYFLKSCPLMGNTLSSSMVEVKFLPIDAFHCSFY